MSPVYQAIPIFLGVEIRHIPVVITFVLPFLDVECKSRCFFTFLMLPKLSFDSSIKISSIK